LVCFAISQRYGQDFPWLPKQLPLTVTKAWQMGLRFKGQRQTEPIGIFLEIRDERKTQTQKKRENRPAETKQNENDKQHAYTFTVSNGGAAEGQINLIDDRKQ
jgi:hypothetical protein